MTTESLILKICALSIKEGRYRTEVCKKRKKCFTVYEKDFHIRSIWAIAERMEMAQQKKYTVGEAIKKIWYG